MNDSAEVVDLEGRTFSGKEKSFRSLQVFQCPVCTARTNLIEIRFGHYRTRSPYPVCPHREEHWHVELRGKLGLISQPHPASYRAELNAEIAALRLKGKDDLIGSFDPATEKPFPATGLNIRHREYD